MSIARAVELPFYDSLPAFHRVSASRRVSGLARFKVDRDTMALLTRFPRYQRPAKGASNRPEYDPESVLPAGGG